MPTLNDVLAGSQAQAVQVQQIIDALKGTPNKGVPVALVSLNDPSNYALTVQNDDPVNSRALSVLKADGTTLISADATGVTLGAPLNVPAGALNGTQLANASVSNAKLGPDVARANQLVNGGFEIWQRGNGPFTATGAYAADRWNVNPAGTDTLSVSKDTTNVDASSASAVSVTFTLGSGAGQSVFYQPLLGADLPQLRGRPLSFSIRVRTATASAVNLAYYDGSAWNYSATTAHPGDGTYRTLTFTYTPTAGASAFNVGVSFKATCTAYLDNAMLVVGSQYADYAPLHPADDLARCLRYYQRWDNTAVATLMLAIGMGYNANTLYAVIPLQAQFGGTPTTTLSAANLFQAYCAGVGTVLTALSAYSLDKRAVTFTGTTASGIASGQALALAGQSAGAFYALEFNP